MAIYPITGSARMADTEAELTASDPLLGMGEILVARDSGVSKMGPGHWASLPRMGAGGQFFSNVSPGSVVNPVAETEAFSLTIPAGTIAVGGSLVIAAAAYLANQTGAAIDHTYRLKFNGATVLATPALPVAQNANLRAWHLDIRGVLRNITQMRVDERLLVSAASAAGVTGALDTTVSQQGWVQPSNTWASTPVVVSLTVQGSATGTTLSLYNVTARHIPPA